MHKKLNVKYFLLPIVITYCTVQSKYKMEVKYSSIHIKIYYNTIYILKYATTNYKY